MKNIELDIEFIKDEVKQLQTSTDLAGMINYALDILYPNSKIYIKANQLNFYSDRNRGSLRYTHFEIPKKNGSKREIKAPVDSLKRIQRALNVILSSIANFNQNATGFIKGKSLIDNGLPHVGKYYVYNIDLKDFFPSITFGRVKAILRIEPYNISEPIAHLIANLCCDNGTLPQGAPTSPLLSNLVSSRLDRKLTGLSKVYRASYTRYADDITFSSYINIFKEEKSFLHEVETIITDQGFKINEAKVRCQGSGYRQIVTGLVVNEKLNLEKKFVKEIRAMLHNWKKFTYIGANEIFKSKLSISGIVPKTELVNTLSGKLNYLRMIRGKDDLLVGKYDKIFSDLLFRDLLDKETYISDTLLLWDSLGIEKAIPFFNASKTGNYRIRKGLAVEKTGPIRLNYFESWQRWVLFRDIFNHKKEAFILFENQHPVLWDYLAKEEPDPKARFFGEIFSVVLTRPLLDALMIHPELLCEMENIVIDVPMLHLENKSFKDNLLNSIKQKIYLLQLKDKSNQEIYINLQKREVTTVNGITCKKFEFLDKKGELIIGLKLINVDDSILKKFHLNKFYHINKNTTEIN